ncbi:MAG: M20/M25/M40 family metallo-hydrolase [Alicyclobacillus shizuokensis]|nr:M20/M25/M40 family metallo-hydrolase [Alicyclobacillus shizuokensis]
MTYWQDQQAWQKLLGDLVAIPSVTGSTGEREMILYIHLLLSQLPYFQAHPEHLRTWPTGDGRYALTALARSVPESPQTVILLSHFDVVPVDEFVPWQTCAFDIQRMTQVLMQEDCAPADVQGEVQGGGWVAGRGSMDMKGGLALHLTLLERATLGAFPGNVLLVTVPDEEANSLGMRTMVPALRKLADSCGLIYRCVLNSEPVFSSPVGSHDHVVYSGSVGKVLPGILCCGKEAHVGEPCSGINATLLASTVATKLEVNPELCDQHGMEASPPPTVLWQADLKQQYSVKIPHRAIVFANLFILRRSGLEVERQLLALLRQAARNAESIYRDRLASSPAAPARRAEVHIRTLSYRELCQYALAKHGRTALTDATEQALASQPASLDARTQSVLCAEAVANLCPELAPMLVLFFAPPFYPAVSSSGHPRVERVLEALTQYAQSRHGVSLQRKHYFPGISDLSYIGLQQSEQEMEAIVANMPIWNRGYDLPLSDMSRVVAPVLNLGPLGRDAHQVGERLHADSAWHITLDLLHCTITELLSSPD